MQERIDVFIPSSKNPHTLSQCLISLSKQHYKRFSVIIVGKKKEQAIINLINQYKSLRITYFAQTGTGLVAAANQALKSAKGTIFVRIDDDVAVDRNWSKAIMETFTNNEGVAGVTGPTLLSAEGIHARDFTNFVEKIKRKKTLTDKILYKIYIQYVCENKLFRVSKFLKSGVFTIGANFLKGRRSKFFQVDYLEACNFAVRTALLRKVGGFDVVFSKGLGDYHEADAAFKIKKLGYRLVFNSRMKVLHKTELDISTVRPDAYHRIKNFIVFYKRHIGIKNIDTLLRFSTYLLLQNIYYTYKFLTSGRADQLGAIAGTFAGLFSK
jgi:GT2 family glycosyltransferase